MFQTPNMKSKGVAWLGFGPGLLVNSVWPKPLKSAKFQWTQRKISVNNIKGYLLLKIFNNIYFLRYGRF